MSLEKRIETEVVASLKGGDKIKVSTLRMLRAAINNFRLSAEAKPLTDSDILKIIQQQVKQHRDSIEQFKKGGRNDLVEKETKELEILLDYMPKQLTDEELKIIVSEVIASVGAISKKEMGIVIKEVMQKVKGAAEGKRVSQIAVGLLK